MHIELLQTCFERQKSRKSTNLQGEQKKHPWKTPKHALKGLMLIDSYDTLVVKLGTLNV
jgi:hypothetical protein